MIDVKELVKRGDFLFEKRTSLLSLWQCIAENFYPERADFTVNRYLGEEFAANLNSSFPILVRRDLGNSFSSMLRQDDWFVMSTDHEDEMDHSAREWLEWASGVQRRAMYDRKANFVRATKECDHDFAAFGQCVISREIDMREMSLLYRCWHLRDVAWCERYNGTIGDIHRKWKPTCSDLCALFPNSVHPSVKRALEKSPYKEMMCRHIVIPSEDYQGDRKYREPYVSIHIDVENNQLMEERGVWSQIYTIPRWQTVSGSQYAYSPATVAGLPDARLLQAMTLTLLEAGEMAVRPPMVAVKEAIRSDVALYAGGITWADAEYDERLGEVLRPITQDKTGLSFGLDIQRDVRSLLSDAFYINKLTLPAPEKDMTAYEVSQRIQEYIRQALPLFEPMEMEYNAAICEDTFTALLRVGAFGPPETIPESLRGADVRFKFKNPLRASVEQQKGTKLQISQGMIEQMTTIDPNAPAILDSTVALRDALTGVGIPQKWLRSEQEVEASNQAMQQRQQVAQTAGAIGQGAQVAEQVGKAGQALNQAA